MTDGYITYAQALFEATIPILQGEVRQWALAEKPMLMVCSQERVARDHLYAEPYRFAAWIIIHYHTCMEKKEEDT